ncbi:hybrid sensor histidine kinase/response regulator [Pseudomonas sp. P42]|uniref:hybrid sensor histidine kinase/response regulator n=1 Tax=Pseudomonas sp. P42 TaxID=1080160 RepID=UPI001B3347E6|nr:hybrid sensor histidine kinase/response regulator [Pseudomonas sp. P42]MBP5952751.1 response regulator [Pseudomonas sp. P42]
MPLNKLKILLVEDSPHDAELTILALEASGIEIDSMLVPNHIEAERELSEGEFDVVLCDYLLPGSSGEDVLHIAKKLSPGTPFIFLSGIFGEQQAVEMIRLGAVDYVLKQNLKMLPKAVRRAVSEVRERKSRLKAETALQDIEVRARLAIEAAMMGIWELDIPTGKILWDERCKAMYELPPTSEVDLDYFMSRCHKDDLPLVQKKVQQALSSPQNYQVEFRIYLSGDRERWIFSNGRSIFENDKCTRFTGVIQDISERKLATNQLVERNEELGLRVEQRTRERDRTWELSRELLAVLRFDMTPVAFNPAWSSALGWSDKQINGIRLWELVHPDDLDATVRETENIARGIIATRFINRMRHISGSYRWLSWTIVPDNGLMYAAVRDITEERAVVDQLAAANQRLRDQIKERERVEAALHQLQRLEVVGQLTAGVAHDFNNLLTVILTSTTFAIRDIEKGTMAKTINRLTNVMQAGERGAKLTAQLLSFSRRQRLVPVVINLNDVIRGMASLITKALGPNITIRYELSSDLSNALGDPTQTEMIILNLAINARDAMPSGGNIILSTSNSLVQAPPSLPEDPEPGTYSVLSISDTGSGMSANSLKKAFEPFFTTKEVGKGSGLGLAQVFGFAKQSGGGVNIESKLDVGTVVRVYLPSVEEPTSIYETTEEPTSNTANRETTVLLVDDDSSVRDVTLQMLESLGYNVIVACDGIEALEKINQSIDIVLTDFAMPNMTGAELAVKVRLTHPLMPIVFVTGYADTDALGLEATSVIQKPFDELTLQKRIVQALRINKTAKR